MLLINGYSDKRKKNRQKIEFRHMSRNEMLNLFPGDHVWFKANDGTARMVKINGKVKTWKSDPNRIEIPCKYGMYEYHTFTELDCDRLLVEVSEDERNELNSITSR